MKRFFWAASLILVAALHSGALAAVPQLLNFQGKLNDSTGAPLNSTKSIIFSLYTSSTDTSTPPLWTETQSVTVTNGAFNVLLGSVNPLPAAVFDNAELWLGITVGSDAEMTPRLRLASVPYAMKSKAAETVSDGAVTAQKLGIPCDDGQYLQYTTQNGWICNAGTAGLPGQPGPSGLAWQGAWDGSKTYAQRDAVTYGGSSYIGLADSNTGNQPDISGTFWAMLAQKGDAGAKGSSGVITVANVTLGLSSCCQGWKTQGNTWQQTYAPFSLTIAKKSDTSALRVTWTDSVGITGGYWCEVGIFLDDTLDYAPAPCTAHWYYGSTGNVHEQREMTCYITGVGAGAHTLSPWDKSGYCYYGNYVWDAPRRSLTVEEIEVGP